jgi:hypothetical protein
MVMVMVMVRDMMATCWPAIASCAASWAAAGDFMQAGGLPAMPLQL